MGRLIYDDEERIRLRRGTFLVLYDVLARTLRNPDAHKEITPGNFEILFQVDEAEKRALHWLVGAIERGVPDAMSSDEKANKQRKVVRTPDFNSYLDCSINWCTLPLDETCRLGCASSRHCHVFRFANRTREVGFPSRAHRPRYRGHLGVAIPARRSWLGQDGPPEP
jgi:hypothetical protein